MTDIKKYTAKDFSRARGLDGLSDTLITEHLALYEGYVKRTNALTEKLLSMCKEGKASGADPIYAEMTRRLGFEYNGMVLHEYYFSNIRAAAQQEPAADSNLRRAIERSFGSYATWLTDFKAIGAMPGVGWVGLFQDPHTGWLSNHWITLHQDGVPAGFTPVLMMDVWEHAFLRDYKTTERARYVEAFFKNIDWNASNTRLK